MHAYIYILYKQLIGDTGLKLGSGYYYLSLHVMNIKSSGEPFVMNEWVSGLFSTKISYGTYGYEVTLRKYVKMLLVPLRILFFFVNSIL